MFDEAEGFGSNLDLRRLLAHYAGVSEADREAWQDRVMTLDGLESAELVRLHGHLLAFGWIEQNTGVTPVVRVGAVPSCYRVTAAGLRAIREETNGPPANDPSDPPAGSKRRSGRVRSSFFAKMAPESPTTVAVPTV